MGNRELLNGTLRAFDLVGEHLGKKPAAFKITTTLTQGISRFKGAYRISLRQLAIESGVGQSSVERIVPELLSIGAFAATKVGVRGGKTRSYYYPKAPPTSAASELESAPNERTKAPPTLTALTNQKAPPTQFLDTPTKPVTDSKSSSVRIYNKPRHEFSDKNTATLAKTKEHPVGKNKLATVLKTEHPQLYPKGETEPQSLSTPRMFLGEPTSHTSNTDEADNWRVRAEQYADQSEPYESDLGVAPDVDQSELDWLEARQRERGGGAA